MCEHPVKLWNEMMNSMSKIFKNYNLLNSSTWKVKAGENKSETFGFLDFGNESSIWIHSLNTDVQVEMGTNQIPLTIVHMKQFHVQIAGPEQISSGPVLLIFFEYRT